MNRAETIAGLRLFLLDAEPPLAEVLEAAIRHLDSAPVSAWEYDRTEQLIQTLEKHIEIMRKIPAFGGNDGK